MKQNYTHSSWKGWGRMAVSSALLLQGNLTHAQEGTQGNTTIFGGAQMTFFSSHDFVTGGGGAQPGVILTERAAGNFGVLNFAGDNLTSTGASDAGYVDGYVRKYGSGRFAAAAEGRTTLLTWATAEETNSDRFEVERSGNGKTWARIGMVASSEESSVRVDYSYVDKAPLSGVNLYRLKMIDKDKTFAYSTIRNVTFTDVGIGAYPNPALDRLLVNDYLKVQEVSINNTSGRDVLRQQRVSDQGIDVSKLAPGTYIVA